MVNTISLVEDICLNSEFTLQVISDDA